MTTMGYDYFLGTTASSGGGGADDGGNIPANAVNGSDSYGDCWVRAGPPDSTSYMQLDIGTARVIRGVRIYQAETVQYATTCYLEGCTTSGGTYTILATLTPSAIGEYLLGFANETPYRYYRLRLGVLVGGNNGFWRVNTIEGYRTGGGPEIDIFAASSGGAPLIAGANYMVVSDPGGIGSTSTVTFYVQNLGDTDLPAGALVYPTGTADNITTGDQYLYQRYMWEEIIEDMATSVSGGAFQTYKSRLPSLTAGGSRIQVDFKYTATARYDSSRFPSAVACLVVSGPDIFYFEGWDQYDVTETFDDTNQGWAGRWGDIWIYNGDTSLPMGNEATGKPRGGYRFHCQHADSGADIFADNNPGGGPFGYAPDSMILGARIQVGTGGTWCAEKITLLAMNLQHQIFLGGSDSPFGLFTGPSGDLVVKIWNAAGGGPRFIDLHTISNPFSGVEGEVYVEVGCRVYGTWDVDWMVALNGSVVASGTYNVAIHDTGHQYRFINLFGVGQEGVADARDYPVLPDPDIYIDDFYASEAGGALTDCAIGEVSILMFNANADGAYLDWTGKSSGTSDYYTYVDEQPYDKDGTYLTFTIADTTPLLTTFAHEAVSATEVLALQVVPYTRKTLSGSGADRVMPLMNSAFYGTFELGRNTFLGFYLDYSTPFSTWPYNPATLEPWTMFAVNEMEIGAIAENPFGNMQQPWRVTQVSMQVMLKPAAVASVSRLMFGSISG